MRHTNAYYAKMCIVRIAPHGSMALSTRSNPTMTTKATRSEISQALAKAIAYRDCGKPSEAAQWATKLVKMLEAEQILAPQYR